MHLAFWKFFVTIAKKFFLISPSTGGIMLPGDNKKALSILKVMKLSGTPLTSFAIQQRLRELGYEMSERTIRAYLLELDRAGFTQNLGRKGRTITPLGEQELSSANVIEKVGFLSAKIDNLTYLMDFDPNNRSGSVVINISIVSPKELLEHLPLIKAVFEKGYGMGSLVTLFAPGERISGMEIPADKVGIGTVCSITLNGVLLKYGIPVHSKFGGLLEVQGWKPLRFLEIIYYDSTTLDPLEIFIKSGMTDYIGAVKSGSGKIGASFRELPAQSKALVVDIGKKMEKVGLGAFVTIGLPGRPVLDVPVPDGRIGAIVIGGLNPIAILEECGCKTYSRALAGLVEYPRLFHYNELDELLKQYI